MRVECVRRRRRHAALAAAASLLIALGGAHGAGAQTNASDAPGAKAPDLDASAWILIDARDGDRLAAHAPNKRNAIASTTKLMTTYLALRDLSLDSKLTVPPYDAAPAESVAGLTAGERLTVRDLLTAMMLPSANDAAETVALGLAPSEAETVDEMNAAAADLGLDHTSYANPIGLDDPHNYSTAADLSSLALELRGDKRFRKIVSLPEATLESGAVERRVINRNTLLLADPTVDGIKTGHTIEAGYVLVASAKREGVPLISVVLGTASEGARDAASAELLDYGYSLYDRRSPFRADEQLASAEVRYGDEPLGLLAKRPFGVPVRADQDLEAEVEAPLEVEGPIAAGEKLGLVSVMLDGEKVGRVPLVAAVAVAEPSLIDKAGGPLVVLAVAVLLIVILLIAWFSLRRRKALRQRGE